MPAVRLKSPRSLARSAPQPQLQQNSSRESRWRCSSLFSTSQANFSERSARGGRSSRRRPSLEKAGATILETPALETSLQSLVRKGDIDAVVARLSAGPPTAQEADEALGLAVDGGHVEIVEALVTVATATGKTIALCTAASTSHIPIISALLYGGADASKGDTSGNTPLFHACKRGHARAAHVLLTSPIGEAARTIGVANRRGQMPLHMACAKGSAPLVHVLLKRGAAVDSTAIAAAMNHGHESLLPRLLRHSEWLQRIASRGLQVQKTLNSLDPLGRFGAVKRELFADVFSMETPFLCEAFVRGFRHAPKEAFCDAVLLARGFEAEAQTVSLNTRGVVDPLGVDQLQLQSVRVHAAFVGSENRNP